ncbi:MAG: hypothetical protein QM781_01930 [Chitinophagaceae bacterium]
MKKTFEKNCGIALLIFILLLLITMVLHPAGGNIAYLIRHSKWIIVIHSVALLSIPFGWLGFWGFSRKLGIADFYSMLGFAFLSVTMMAVLFAATANGLVLPLFLQHYADAAETVIDSALPVVRYNFTVNKAFDYVYTSTYGMAVLCWSVAILRSGRLPRWIGITGILLFLTMLFTLLSGLAVNSLQGLRISMAGFITWSLIVAISMLQNKAGIEDIYPAQKAG